MTPPELRIGSTRQAARLPTDCASMSSNAKSNCRRQSSSPEGVVKSGRYRFGVGMAKLPGAAGPYPLRPVLYVAAAAAWVIPCQDRANDTTSCRPVTSLAMRTAASLDSAPVVSSSVLDSGGGSDPASRRHSSTTGRDSIPLNRWSSVPICSRTVATIRGCAWPRIALICPEVKSRIRRPSSV
jgi:hypothetical protein